MALEARMSLHLAGDQEVARGASLRSMVAESRKAHYLAVCNARWGLHRHRLSAAGEPGAMALWAGATVLHSFACAIRTSACDAEGALAEDFVACTLTS